MNVIRVESMGLAYLYYGRLNFMVSGLCGGVTLVVQLNLGFAPLEVVSYNAVLGALGAQWTLGDVRFFCVFFST